MWKKLVPSMLSGSTAHVFFLLIAFILDKFMNNKTSNMIALLAGAILNFILQYNVFMKKTALLHKIVIKYIISELLVIGSVQLGVSFLLDNKDKYKRKFPVSLQKYYNTIIRMFVATVVSLLISFPIRNRWVFIL